MTDSATPLQPPRPRRRWVLPLVIVSVIAVVSLVLIGGVFAVRSILSGFGDPVTDQSLLEGEPGSPVSEVPLVCSDPCFTADSIDDTLPPETTFNRFGVPDTTFPAGTYDPATAGELHRGDAAGWQSYDGEPDACFFAPTNSPYGAALDEVGAEESTDLVYFTGTHEDADFLNTLDQAVRIFPDSASAERYLTTLADSIEACPELQIGPESDRYFADINAAPALDVPESVAAIGWVRTGDPGQRWRAYIIDLQRGNLVIRTRLLTDGGITEWEFRSFVENYAEQVAAIEPPAP